MSDKKNIGRKALDENNLENVSGGYVDNINGKWVAHKPEMPWGSIDPQPESLKGYYKEFDTREEAVKYDRAHGGKGAPMPWPGGWHK